MPLRWLQATCYIITALNKKKEKHKVCKRVCRCFSYFHSIFTPTKQFTSLSKLAFGKHFLFPIQSAWFQTFYVCVKFISFILVLFEEERQKTNLLYSRIVRYAAGQYREEVSHIFENIMENSQVFLQSRSVVSTCLKLIIKLTLTSNMDLEFWT